MVPQTQEDYWEDASVSLGCSHGWGFPSICCPPPPSPAPKEDACNEKATDAGDGNGSKEDYRYFVEFCSSSSARRFHSFPPPLTVCGTLSIKEGGRFVLKEIAARPSPQSCFRAERENGRLRLCLIEPEDLDECNEVHLDTDNLVAPLPDEQVQDAFGVFFYEDEHLVCHRDGEFSKSLDITAGDAGVIDSAPDTGLSNSNSDDVPEKCNANADDVPEICDGTLDTRHGDANANDVPDTCDGIPVVRYKHLDADALPETVDKDLCRVYVAASLHGHLVCAGCSSLPNFEMVQALNDRTIDVCIDAASRGQSLEMLPQMLDAGAPMWTTTDAASLIHLCHGSFAKLGPTVGLAVS